MSISTIKVSEKGQIAIPKSIRQKIGIEKGDELIIIYKDNKILLEKSSAVVEKIKDDFRDIVKFNEKALKSVWDNKKDDIWNQIKQELPGKKK